MAIGSVVFQFGQSNGMAYGTLNQALPGGWTPEANERIWTGSTFATYQPGVNSFGDGSGGTFGPEAGFLLQRRDKIATGEILNEPIHIIKHAIGSCGLAPTPIGEADFNPWSYGAGKEWDAALAKLIAGLNALNAAGFLAVIDTMLSVDGETDTKGQSTATGYHRSKIAQLTAFRARTLTFNSRAVLVRCWPNETQGEYLETVQLAQEAIGSLPRHACVNVDAIAVEASGFSGAAGHTDCESTVAIGRMMFDADFAIEAGPTNEVN